MLNSQAFETAIGIALMLFLFATAASAVTEAISAVLKKRAKDLERALADMLNSGELPAEVAAVTTDDAQMFIQKATGKVHASYMSAKSFADAATELIAKAEHLGVLQGKMDTLARETRGQLTSLKAGLETWFDETMAAARDKYSKWASFILFGIGVVLAASLNASVINVGHDLWADTAARQAVVSAAASAGNNTAACDPKGSVTEQASCAISDISSFQLPIGWGSAQRADASGAQWWLVHILGWLLTGALVMLGGPFWFDLLSKLVNLRASGPPPPPAPKDDGSSTTLVANGATPDMDSTRIPTEDLALQRIATRLNQQRDEVTMHQVQLGDLAPPDPNVEGHHKVDWLATALNMPTPLRRPPRNAAPRRVAVGNRVPEPVSNRAKPPSHHH